MFKNSGFDKQLDKATSHFLMEPDWTAIMQICDQIRQDDIQPKYALTAIKKKLASQNPHSAMFAMMVLESVVKNCPSVHDELTSKAYCETLHEFVKTTPHIKVKEKMLELLQVWNSVIARKNAKHSNLKDLVTVMKAEGFTFPAYRESEAMFTADSAPKWVDGEVCHHCRVQFGVMQRKHHCRACGQVFCGQCSQKNTPLPKFGIEKEVRVCDACFELHTKPFATAKSVEKDSDLPIEYLKSSLAQQSQVPPKKNEDELREEEELQLALALSQSEAEAKEKQKMRVSSTATFSKVQESKVEVRSQSPEESPELSHYLNRTYWENRQQNDNDVKSSLSTPSVSASAPIQNIDLKFKENGMADVTIEDFTNTLRSQVEIFINRMKSNSSRGRSIATDSSVQTLFMNLTKMHSQLLKYIQQHDDNRIYYEGLQDKLTQVKDARAALDALREEHREKLRRQAEEAERQRQLQMAHKLDIMRKKKQEYLQYQRQLALQRIQEQEREMQMRQEQQKQQYMINPQFGGYMGSPIHGPQYQSNPQPMGAYYQYAQPNMMMGYQIPPQGVQPPQNIQAPHPGMPQNIQSAPQNIAPPQNIQAPPQNLHGPPQNVQVPPPPGMQGPPQNIQVPPQNIMQNIPPGQGIPPPMGQIPPMQLPPALMGGTQGMMGQQGGVPMTLPQYQQPGAPPPSPQVQQTQEETQTAELISFD
ncbi:hepatocyte growth factor-regulated tyrosine kinase substrate [Onthophagus taurus]|uniref:hepatocyte growth factor-regulated tyrosine kinase substrate n=1 Tax=Onthophagus taurus TaxID=166361 RepID=UPI000C207679|nr:hepatocyte growth factor-regulated tyrosine kinase substrate-like [Onthophagus taurus]